MKSWLHDSGFKIYSTHKSVVPERFIRTLKNEIEKKQMTAVSKNVYINKLDKLVDKYKKTYLETIKMKPVDVQLRKCIEYGVERNDKNPKFKVGHHVKILN